MGGVLRRGSRMLLCRRRADRESYPDVWDLPGGHVEDCEDDSGTLARECREELGVDVVGSFGVALAEPTPGTCLSLRLITRWRGEPRNFAPEEHREIGWFTADELCALELADSGYVPLLTDLLRPSPNIEIRRLNEAAMERVGALHALSRHETYSPLLPPCPTVRFRPADLAARWRVRPGSEHSPVVHGGWSGEVLLGFVAISPTGLDRAELNALHVRPDWHGRGLADRLHRAALAHAYGQGVRDLHLWVVEDNVRARRFYEKHGWRLAGNRRTVNLGDATLPAIDFARRL